MIIAIQDLSYLLLNHVTIASNSGSISYRESPGGLWAPLGGCLRLIALYMQMGRYVIAADDSFSETISTFRTQLSDFVEKISKEETIGRFHSTSRILSFLSLLT